MHNTLCFSHVCTRLAILSHIMNWIDRVGVKFGPNLLGFVIAVLYLLPRETEGGTP